MFESAVSLLSIWASMNSWLTTPAVLFLLLNLMIGTIAVTSGFTTHKTHHPQTHTDHHTTTTNQLTRSPSVLQRLRSISNFYSYIHYSHAPQQPPPPPPPQQQPTIVTTHVAEPPLVSSHQSLTVVMAGSKYAPNIPEPKNNISPVVREERKPKVTVVEDEEGPTIEYDNNNDDDDGPTMDEVYNLIIQKANAPHYNRQKSDTCPTSGEPLVPLPRKIKKSATDESAFAHFEPADNAASYKAPPPPVRGGDVGVDAKADDFINKFREQLKLQRLESLYGGKISGK